MTVVGEAVVAVKADASHFASEAKQQIEPGIAGVAKNVATILGGAFVGRAFIGQVKAGLEELKDQQAVQAQTAAAIESTGGAAGVSAQHVNELSEELLHLSGTDDEVITKGQDLLLSFVDVQNKLGEGNDVFDRATKAGLDLASRGFGSVEGNARLLGIALSDPEQGLTRLRRAGIVLTEQQKDSIKQFASQNDLLGEQRVLLDAVEKKVGGAAKAYGETLGGQVAIAEESIKNARAEMLSSAAPALEIFASAATTAADAVQDLPGPLRDTVAVVGTLAVAFVSVARPVGAALDLISRLRGATEATTTATEGQTVATQALTTAEMEAATAEGESALAAAGLIAANEGVAASATGAAVAEDAVVASSIGLAGGLALAVAGAGIAYGVYSALSEVWTDNSTHVGDYTTALESNTGATDANIDAVTRKALADSEAGKQAQEHGIALDVMLRAVRTGTEDWGEFGRILGRHTTDIQGNSAQVKQLATELRGAGADSTEFGRSLLYLIEHGDMSAATALQLVHQLEGMHNGFTDATGAAKAHTDAQSEVAAAVGGTTTQVELEQDAIDQAAKAVAGYTGFIDNLAGAMGKQYDASVSNTELNSRYQASIDALTKSVVEHGDTLDADTDKGRSNIDAALAAGKAIEGLIEKRFQETHSTKDAIAAGSLYVENLKEQLRNAGLTEDQVQSYIDTMGLTPDKLETTFSNNAVEQQLVVGQYLAQLDKIPPKLQSEIRASIESGDYDRAQKQLDNLANDRDVNYAINLTLNTVVSGSGAVRRLAKGTDNWAGGWAMVGEEGAELAYLPAGAKVIPNSKLGEGVQRALGIPGFVMGLGVPGFDPQPKAKQTGATSTQAQIEDVMYEVGAISQEDYRAILQARLAATEQFSSEWEQVWQKISGIDAHTVEVEQQTASEHERIHDNMFKVGALNAAQYEEMLQHRLAGLQQFSDEWTSTWEELQNVESTVASEHERIHDNMFKVGDLSTTEYLAMLNKRLAATEKYSDEWLAIWQKIDSINNDASKSFGELSDRVFQNTPTIDVHDTRAPAVEGVGFRVDQLVLPPGSTYGSALNFVRHVAATRRVHAGLK